MNALNDKEIQEMKQIRSYFPYRTIAGVKLDTGEFHVFSNGTLAKANNFARKNNGQVFTFNFRG